MSGTRCSIAPTEEYPKIYWSAPEFALVDDAGHPDGRNPLTSAGAAHSLYAPPRGVIGLQGDHGGVLQIRRMRIREITTLDPG